MADPLSVAASVVGLLAAGGKIASLLSKAASLADAPSSAKSVLTEMNEISSALQYLQTFLNGLMNVPAGRQQYILVEHLEATLTGFVTTYDELEDLMQNFETSDMGVVGRFAWARKEKEIASIVQKLQHHKSSLNLMLTILQCTASSEIQQSVVKLCNLLEQEVSRNDDLSIRLSRVERNHAENATVREDSLLDNEDNDTIRPERTSNDANAEMDDINTLTFTFESILVTSRVYARAKFLGSDCHSESSITSSDRRNAAFAIFSSQSLADISNLSVYTLPIAISELSNKTWYITIPESSPSGEQSTETQVLIRSFTGKTVTFSISSKDTILQLKEKFRETDGCPTDWVVLALG